MATKKQLIQSVSKSTGIHEEDVSFIYDSIFDEIKDVVKKEGSFTVSRFGKFSAYQTKERGKLNKNFKSSKKVKFTISQIFFNILNK